jgi:hypothetical protein
MKMKRLLLFLFLLINMIVLYGQDDEIYLEDNGSEKLIEYKETFMGTELYKLELDRKYGIKHKNRIVIPVEYDELPMHYSDRMIVKKTGKYGIINKKNKVLFNFIHQTIKPTNNKEIVIAGLKKRDTVYFGVYTDEGKIISDFEYIDCNENLFTNLGFNFDYSCTCLNGTEKLFDIEGKLLKSLPGKITWKLSNEFYRIIRSTDGINLYFGVVDNDLNVIIEPNYNQIDWVYKDRYFCVTEFIGSYSIVKLFDSKSQKNLIEMDGFFRGPNNEGILKHHFKNGDGKWEIEELDIEELIKR